jgi:hypothetical protein
MAGNPAMKYLGGADEYEPSAPQQAFFVRCNFW